MMNKVVYIVRVKHSTDSGTLLSVVENDIKTRSKNLDQKTRKVAKK